MLIKQRMTNVVEKWFVVEPLFFAVWTTHELSINSNIQNIRVGQGRIEYNPAFIEALNDKILYQVLQFEVMRIILKHPYLRRKERQSVAYTASNITIQEYMETPLDFPNAKQTFQTDEYDNKYFEFYYQKLLEQEDSSLTLEQSAFSCSSKQNGQQSNDPQTSKGQSDQKTEDSERQEEEQSPEKTQDDESGEAEKSEEKSLESTSAKKDDKQTKIDQYIDPLKSGMENTELWDANEYYSNQINDKIELAQENNSWGTIPGRVQERILATLKPKINYREVLKSFRASILSVNRVLTRMKPSRRYGFLYMGSRRDFCTQLLFAVDVSGSVSSIDIQKAFSIINQLFKYGIQSVDVLQFDAEIKGKPLSLKRAKYKVQVLGRGGTEFQPVLDYIDTDKNYDGLIIFTDGWAPVPNPPKNRRTRVLWLFNNENNYEKMKDDLRLIGRSTFIKEN
ncbi:VWA-like domain-containing protein [Candidatus Parabeggiatoa sp. HSG14]|uniref:DUF2201 family putative metallopeptidase n=1 Tax=Candidatus Parabeggiatoa sp. HSG14 TaxID=3055593 RepID=UPI0025A73AB8|nr:VWA-like domain-containing protein [Thiotrichales bacterium HSG14]